jgi:hypothetical protein
MTASSSSRPSMWQRSTTRRFLKWLFSWRTAPRTLISFAVIVTLIGLFYAEENWRGKHTWEKFKHEWEARGERFDRASVVPPPVPDDQNFALTPIVVSSYSYILDKNGHQIRPPHTNVVNRLKMETAPKNNNLSLTNGTGNWQKSTVSDLKVWQQYYRALAAKTNEFPAPSQPQSSAADVLLALSKYDPAIEELRQASNLPYSRFPLEYDREDTFAILLPHLNVLRGCARVLQLRAIAELQNGQSGKALDDVKLMLRLTDSVRTEPFLISHLVRIAILGITMQPVWEGLVEHKWSDAQLIELDRELVKLDFLADYKLSMRGEMVCQQGGMFDYLRHHPEQLPQMSIGGDSDTHLAAQIFRLIPSGWFYQNQLRCARPMVESYVPVADVTRGVISPAATRRADAAVDAENEHLNPYNIIARMLLPALGNAARKFASGQSSVDLARVAIALERYRLAHGQYPGSLEALAPQFIAKLPHDVINGQPLKYRRTSDGRFVLYSVGWNETDDGGEIGLTSGRTPRQDLERGDWVWQYPPAQ